ncbi:amylo-alpha-1,6-glucosidase [Nesterenkonia sp. LB17]|uniref:glycogen debranching N-terminal domain-containing protein n=1 Tax=Nesterenkonia sp. LB17 TaxID=2901230 RepID=UPI001F4CC35D|nr:glycogen debranching N-terminal domain-containing protein [Nesterenkonia sp. LB17]MCH8564395.1 amylo-alpha-1,6-glucosidase [Nesterenkonia sp. LB17]
MSEQQPWLHDLEIAVNGPATALSAGSGRMGEGATGWIVDDRRILRSLYVCLSDEDTVPIAASSSGPTSDFWGAARHLGDPGADPTVDVHQSTQVGLHELLIEITVSSRASSPVNTVLQVSVGSDGIDLSEVKGGHTDGAAPEIVMDEQIWWSDARHRTTLHASPAPASVERLDASRFRQTWPLQLGPGESRTVSLRFDAIRTSRSAHDADSGVMACDWDDLEVTGDDAWRDLVRTNLTDLKHLLQKDPEAPEDIYAAAGTPWYLTLFGRDSVWAARMMLPYSPRLARGTLRTLARRQARSADPVTAAEPGKMLHEVRREIYAQGEMELPTVYYGTVDATPLWIVLLHESWQAGLDLGEVRELLPNLLAALDWQAGAVDASPDGFLRYVDHSGKGLSNQGWKDSGDSMRRADGSIAPAPIALLEAQAYAVQAAYGAAELLDALGEPGAQGWRAWGESLAQRVRENFWVDHDGERFLAMGLDAEGAPLDGVGSNMGHALGTGLLTKQEEDLVVERITRPDMLRRFGIGTLSAENPAYNPTGYHTGSVWVHDTAIILRGMAQGGYTQQADQVFDALVRLSARSRHRFPELIAGEPVGREPVPYPAACRPQAWSAASAAVLMQHAQRR